VCTHSHAAQVFHCDDSSPEVLAPVSAEPLIPARAADCVQESAE
jgi:hypothetical protein